MASLRSVPLASVIDKNKKSSGNAWIQLLEILIKNPTQPGTSVTTIYIANNDADIAYNGETYIACPFEMNVRQESGSVPEVTLTVTDYKQTISTYLNGQSGAIGSEVTMTIVDAGNLSAKPELQEKFDFVSCSISDYSVSIKLGAENDLAKAFPRRRMMRDRCSWRYKGEECGYTGARPSCDLTLQGPNGCAVHNNEGRYGGFPGVRPGGT